jgi:ATP-dependent protease ClpP protease subunit
MIKSLADMGVEKLRAGWGDDPREFEVTVQPMHSVIYKIKLFGAIEEPQQFASAIEAFERAQPDDKVLVHLQSPGGSVDATDAFLHAMHNCQAPVHIVATGGCHSAATIILMNAQSFTLSDNFYALIHNGSTGTWGKMSDYKAETAFTSHYMEELMKKTYEGFLTDDEIQRLIEGKDFWFGPKEFCERHERRNEWFAAQEQADVLEQLGEAQEQLESLIEKVKTTPPPRRRKKTADEEA